MGEIWSLAGVSEGTIPATIPTLTDASPAAKYPGTEWLPDTSNLLNQPKGLDQLKGNTMDIKQLLSNLPKAEDMSAEDIAKFEGIIDDLTNAMKANRMWSTTRD